MSNQDNAMRKVLEFDAVFVVRARMTKASGSFVAEENRTIIKEVLDSTMNPGVMGNLSEEQQNDYIKQSLKTVLELEKQEDEESDEINCIDLFSLRVLSLMVCRGRGGDKASFLASMANLDNDEPVSWDSTRLSRGLKLMLYISGMLPHKFMMAHRDQDVYENIMNPKGNDKA